MQYQKPAIVQVQKLKMNPQLYQSIQLMALPIQELRQKIQEELERNPALEIVSEKTSLSLEEIETNPIESFEYFENSSDPGFTRTGNTESGDSKRKFLEGTLSRPETLHEHLLWQLRLQPLDQVRFELGEILILNLDNDGFHREEPQKIVPPDRVHLLGEMIDLIRSFDPPGICTGNYTEALLVQAGRSEAAPPYTLDIIRDHLDDVNRKKYQEISKTLKTTLDSVLEAVEFIRNLDPFPGRSYYTGETRYVIPDLLIEYRDGEFKLILNDEELTVLGINSFFQELIHGKKEAADRKVTRFVNKNVRNAKWFIRSIDQRNTTLMKVAQAIIEFQRAFFMKGPKYLVPLTLRDIAQEVNVHETTVSRIANSKYIQTEWGIFELKYFFSNSISGTGSNGSRYSKEAVKEIIKEIVKDNPKRLSDQKISEILKKRGISIARRTVAKYRHELDIASSFQR